MKNRDCPYFCFWKIGTVPIFLLALALAGAAHAQWPAKPIRFIVSFPPGGSSDLVARAVAAPMSERLGQPVVVENRPGAGGNIGVDAVAKSAPDGYTIGLAATGALTVNPTLYARMPFDPQRDLAPITLLAMIPFLVVANPAAPPTLAQTLAAAKQQPLSYGHGGNGSAMHLSGELLKMMSGAELVPIAYKGSGPVSADVLGGQVPLGIVDVPSAIAAIKAGKLRALAVTTDRRLASLPDVPTVAEAGVPGYESIGWFGAVAPAATPSPIIERLHGEMTAALAAPEVRARVIAAGTEPLTTSPAQFAAMIRDETRKWAEVIRRAGVKLE
jgi:tripartite-type tricarboxylate transporter receptor subunit TctC